MQTIKPKVQLKIQIGLLIAVAASVIFYGCNSSANKPGGYEQPPQVLPVISINNIPATTYQEYSASLEGKKDIEIRPQVEGYLDRIYVDEGAYVRKGQALFHINEQPYREQFNNAQAALVAARANLSNAQINVSKIKPLVDNRVVSDVQLRTAEAAYDAAAANVNQAQAMVQSAQINIGYTTIKAPVDGYVGRIPHKAGSLVGVSTAEPLTVISEIKDVYAYFSMSENDFLHFKNEFPGATIAEKVKQMPPVDLMLPDNSIYPQKGKVETVSGQFNQSMGTISFRATFPNPEGLLRSGNTGTIRIPRTVSTALVIPQESTFEIQDKVFVFVLADSNKVMSTPVNVIGRSGNYYLLGDGIAAGTKIVYTGLDRLRDGAVIQPEPMSMDSLLKARPL